MRRDWSESASLYAPGGGRKYLNRAERSRVLAEMARLPKDQALFALTLAWTGARISEVLALTPISFQIPVSFKIDGGIVAIETLKRRKYCVREIPIPPELIAALDKSFGLSVMKQGPRVAGSRLWPWHRVTAWRIIKGVMARAGIFGTRASARGLRHSFGVNSASSGVVLNLVQRWMGHARLSTTAIYTNVCGPEELAFAKKLWCAVPIPSLSEGKVAHARKGTSGY
jgi:integrase/recombinase XerD